MTSEERSLTQINSNHYDLPVLQLPVITLGELNRLAPLALPQQRHDLVAHVAWYFVDANLDKSEVGANYIPCFSG